VSGHTDTRNGFNGLAVLVQEMLRRSSPTGRRLALGRLIRPSRTAREGEDHTVAIKPARLGYFAGTFRGSRNRRSHLNSAFIDRGRRCRTSDVYCWFSAGTNIFRLTVRQFTFDQDSSV
jgi:hypothetical protein